MPRLPFAECAEKLGHCWESFIPESNPELCRHCGATRTRDWRVEKPVETQSEPADRKVDGTGLVKTVGAEVPSDG